VLPPYTRVEIVLLALPLVCHMWSDWSVQSDYSDSIDDTEHASVMILLHMYGTAKPHR
jgi:hypothetical protein